MYPAFGGTYPPITQNFKKIYPGFVLWKDWQKIWDVKDYQMTYGYLGVGEVSSDQITLQKYKTCWC